jgi:outer membrane protein TolC
MRTFILTQFLVFHLSFFVCLGNTSVDKETLPEDLTLDNILRNTLLNNGQIKESLQDIEIARGQLEQARAIFYPKAAAMMLAAPIFKETGNAVSSTQDWSTWGPYLSGGVQVVQPIYTFGMGSSYKKAAEGQLNANTHLSEMKKDEIIFTAKEMYYGFLMASDFEKLVDDLIQYLEEAVNSTEGKKGKGKNAVKQHDIYRLKTALDDLKQKKLYAIQGKQTAEKAVGWVSGLQFQKLPSQALLPQDFDKLSLDEYLKLAKAHRPEFKALAAGKEARSALRDAKRAHSYPVIFIGAMAEVNWSPVRERQPSIFANDPFNRIWGGGRQIS